MGKPGLTTMAAAMLMLACAAAPASAQQAAGATTGAEASVEAAFPDTAYLKASEPEGIARYLRYLGYRAILEKDPNGDPVIETGMGGFKVMLWFYDCTDGRDCQRLQLQLGVAMEKKLDLETVNAWNRRKRFQTLHLDEENDPILSHDMSTVAPGMPAAQFRDVVELFEGQVAELRRIIVAHDSDG